MNRNRSRLLLVGGAAVALVGFLLFRPDTLFTDVTVDQSLEEAFATTSTSAAPSTAPTTTGATTTSPTTAPPATGPVVVAAGAFSGIDHSATGTVNVYEQAGRFVLRFEGDTDIQNGPDLYVWMLPSESYEGGIPREYLDLGTLAGTVGGQNYDLPEDFDPTVHRTVLIWCLRFAVPFAAAQLR